LLAVLVKNKTTVSVWYVFRFKRKQQETHKTDETYIVAAT